MDSKLISLARYLAGDTYKNNHAIVWDRDRSTCFPVTASLVSEYLSEVNRFLFSGGISVTLRAGDDHRKAFLDDILRANQLNSKLESIFFEGSIGGELFILIRPTYDSYRFEFFDSTEYTPIYENDSLQRVEVLAKRHIDGEPYLYKLVVDTETFSEWDLVPASQEQKLTTTTPNVQDHTYGFVPGVVIKNKVSLSSKRGIPEFNYAACRIAANFAIGFFDSFENLHFFGNPILSSVDPEDTLRRLQQRIQVHEKDSTEPNSSLEALRLDSLSETHLKLLDRYRQNFYSMMGIRLSTEAPREFSSLALRLLNGTTINKAETKWEAYVSDGLEPLLNKVLNVAVRDGHLVGFDTEENAVRVSRKRPYFPLSPTDQLQSLAIAERLIDLGVDRAVALQETVYRELSIEEIQSKLSPNLEDI